MISKYFNKTDGPDSSSSSSSLDSSIESPYKKSLSELKLKPIDNDDADDFKTPIPIKKASKIFPKKLKQTRLTSKKKYSKSNNQIEKVTKDNFVNLDVNPEHLQMAIALSKSTFELENPLGDHVEEDLPTTSCSNKHGTLERFGFKLNKLKSTGKCSSSDRLEVIIKCICN